MVTEKKDASSLNPGDQVWIRRTSGKLTLATIRNMAPKSSMGYMAPELVFADVTFNEDGKVKMRGINRFDLVDYK